MSRPCESTPGPRSGWSTIRRRLRSTKIGSATERCEPEDFFLSGLMLGRAGRLEMALEVWSKAVREDGRSFPRCSTIWRSSRPALQRSGPGCRCGAAAGATARLGGARALSCWAQLESMVENPNGAVDGDRAGTQARSRRAKARLCSRPLSQAPGARVCSSSAGPGEARQLARSRLRESRAGRCADPEAHWLLSRAVPARRTDRRGRGAPGKGRDLSRR